MTASAVEEVLPTPAAMSTATPTPEPVATPTPTPPAERSRLGVHWDERVASFRLENATLDRKAQSIVFVGDSLTQAYPLEQYYPGLQVLNRGIKADGITPSPGMPPDTGVLNRMGPSIYDTHPSVVIVLLGTNHLAHESEQIGTLLSNYMHLYDLTMRRCPGAQFIVTTVPPVGEKRQDREYFNARVRAFNDALKAFAMAKALPVVDLYSVLVDENGLLCAECTGDGVHLTPLAYERWTAALKPHLPMPEVPTPQ